jgi:hypothetical protein
MKTQFLPLFKRMAEMKRSRFAGYYGGGVDIYARTNYRDPSAKVKVEVNWSTYGNMDPRQAKIFQKNLKEAIDIANKLSYKLTEKEFRELNEYTQDMAWENRRPRPETLGGVF